MNIENWPVRMQGLIKPGGIYTITDSANRGWQLPPLDYIYIIRSDKDVELALDLIVDLWASDCKSIRFSGMESISEDCFVARFQMIYKEEVRDEDGPTQFYFHRLPTVEEKIEMRNSGIDN